MPTYEYACSKCGEHLEVVQSFRDDPLTKCPACGGRLKKVFGNVGIVFKGSGFYKTDSRKSATTAKAGSSVSEKSTTSESGSSSDSSSSSSESAASGKGKETKETKEKSPSGKASSGSSATPAAAS